MKSSGSHNYPAYPNYPPCKTYNYVYEYNHNGLGIAIRQTYYFKNIFGFQLKIENNFGY